MSQWVGCAVSVSCVSPLGSYQGCVAAADGATITLTRPFRNGFPYPKDQVTLNAADIRDLRIISDRPQPPAPPSTVEARHRPRTTVLETLQANTTTSNKPAPNTGTTNKKSKRGNRREEGWSPPMAGDFDFESNLRLFDKVPVVGPPDVVPARYGPDRDVLEGARRPQVIVPAALTAGRWRGEDGAPLPGVTGAGRAALWAELKKAGVLDEACVLLARAAADLALRLVGGARRLHRDNHHQAPTVLATCSTDRIGGVCLETLRILESHGVRTRAEVTGGAGWGRWGQAALGRWKSAGGGGGGRPDLILCGGGEPPSDAPLAALLCLERVRPNARACLFALLPPAAPPPGAQAPQLLLANVAPPACVFAALDISYEPPFGASTLLALYPDDQDA